MPLEFQCQVGGSDFCFNGGICKNSSDAGQQQEICVCPEGFIHDFFGFHFENCTLPSQFYLVYFLVTSGITLISFPVLFYLTCFAKDRLRMIGRMQLVNILINFFGVLCIYLQNGVYEGFVLVWLQMTYATVQLYYVFIHLTIKPLLIFDGFLEVGSLELWKRSFRKHLIVPIIWCSLNFAICVTAASLSRNPDPHEYNLVVLIFCFVTPIGISSCLFGGWRQNMQLFENLQQAWEIKVKTVSHEKDRIAAELLRKYKLGLDRNQKEVRSTLFIMTSWSVPTAIVVLICGSVPYFWVFNSLAHTASLGMTTGTITLLRLANVNQTRQITFSVESFSKPFGTRKPTMELISNQQ